MPQLFVYSGLQEARDYLLAFELGTRFLKWGPRDLESKFANFDAFSFGEGFYCQVPVRPKQGSREILREVRRPREEKPRDRLRIVDSQNNNLPSFKMHVRKTVAEAMANIVQGTCNGVITYY